MAATTTLLGLVTPTQGTLTGTWGDTVNYGISDYLDIAIAGTLSFAGDGAITLANTTGSSSGNSIGATTAQYMVIRVTGTQTITKIITGPSYSKLYMVDHAGATSAVTFKAAGQTGVSVAVGEKCFVYYNGTDYVKVASSVADGVTTIDFGSTGLTPNTATSGAVTVAGTLAVANGGTGVTTSTGTTNVVLSNSPTLVTPVLGVATATSLQGIIGNVTPAAGNFTTLGASSTATLNTLVSSGATLTGGTINGMTVGATTASTGAFTTLSATGNITSVVGGNLSVSDGTLTTNQSLVANANVISLYNNFYFNAGFKYITSHFASNIELDKDNGIITASLYASGTANNALPAASAKWVLSTTGLAVTGTLSATGTLSGGTSGTAYSFSGSAPATSLTLDSSGNLGIGVTPSANQFGNNLQVNQTILNDDNAGSNHLTKNAFYNSGWKYYSSDYASKYTQASSVHSWYTAASGTAGNAITFTQAMTLDASGNLFVGTTSFGANKNYFLYSPGNAFGDFSHESGVASGSAYVRFIFNGSEIGSITQSGTTAVLYNTTSDQRLKQNIQDSDSASSLIDAIQVRKFDWKSDGSHTRYGFVAQELVTVAPEAVHQPTDPDEMMAVDYSKLVPMLVKELQSLRARVAQLESKP